LRNDSIDSRSFNNDTVGSPPAVNQNIGTLSFNAAAGRIKVVATPAPDVPSTKWVQITEDALRCKALSYRAPLRES
jgi:hypothetical protein